MSRRCWCSLLRCLELRPTMLILGIRSGEYGRDACLCFPLTGRADHEFRSQRMIVRFELLLTRLSATLPRSSQTGAVLIDAGGAPAKDRRSEDCHSLQPHIPGNLQTCFEDGLWPLWQWIMPQKTTSGRGCMPATASCLRSPKRHRSHPYAHVPPGTAAAGFSHVSQASSNIPPSGRGLYASRAGDMSNGPASHFN